MIKALTIAGSDSGGGAGIQADLKAFSARGVFGMSAITALTAQNTIGVQGIYDIPPEFVGKQIDSVMKDMGADVWKTGMLSNAKIIEIVAEKANNYEMPLLVLDPVMVAKSGDYLLRKDAIESLIKQLVPLSYIITPNINETMALTGFEIDNMDAAEKAAIKIHEMGAKNVLIKGGHMSFTDEAMDIFYDGRTFTKFISERVETNNTHGTGCTYASAIAAELGKGNETKKAIHVAKAYLTAAIKQADEMKVGRGHGPTNHFQGTEVTVDLNLVKVT